MRELWDDNDTEVSTVYTYFTGLANRLQSIYELAKQEFLKAQEIQKVYCDRKTKIPQFKAGDQCLVITTSNALVPKL